MTRRQSGLCGNYGRLCQKFHVWVMYDKKERQLGLCGISAGHKLDFMEILLESDKMRRR